MGNEPDTAQLEKIAPETMSVDKTLNSKGHNNVKSGNKDDQKNKTQDSPKRKTKDLKREDTIPHRINKIVTVTEIDQIEAATGSIL